MNLWLVLYLFGLIACLPLAWFTAGRVAKSDQIQAAQGIYGKPVNVASLKLVLTPFLAIFWPVTLAVVIDRILKARRNR